MVVLRSIMYISGKSDQHIKVSKYLRPDVLVLDLEDSVPYPMLPEARERVRKAIPEVKEATGSLIYCRINDWRTGFTEGDLDRIVVKGLDGVVLAKTEGAEDVKLLDHRLSTLEEERGFDAGSISIQCLIETAKGVVLAHESAGASQRLNSLVFGAVDFTRDMQTKITPTSTNLARSWVAIAARSAGLTPIDAPWMSFRDLDGFRKDTIYGKELGYQGRMLVVPSQIAVSHEVFTLSEEEVNFAREVVEIYEEAQKKGITAVIVKGQTVDVTIYHREKEALTKYEEVLEWEKKKEPLTADGVEEFKRQFQILLRQMGLE